MGVDIQYQNGPYVFGESVAHPNGCCCLKYNVFVMRRFQWLCGAARTCSSSPVVYGRTMWCWVLPCPSCHPMCTRAMLSCAPCRVMSTASLSSRCHVLSCSVMSRQDMPCPFPSCSCHVRSYPIPSCCGSPCRPCSQYVVSLSFLRYPSTWCRLVGQR